MMTSVTRARSFDVDSFLSDRRSFPKQSYTIHPCVPIYRANQGLSAVVQAWIRH